MQEVWRLLSPEKSGRQVERIVTLFGIDSKSGMQQVLEVGTRDYRAGPNDVLEGVFDQYSSKDVPLGGILP